MYLLQPFNGSQRPRIGGKLFRLLHLLQGAEQLRKLQKNLLKPFVHGLVLEQTLHGKIIFIFNVLIQLFLNFLLQPGLLKKASVKGHLAQLHLELLKASLPQAVNDHGNHLGIRILGIIPNQLGPCLSPLLKAALITAVILKSAFQVAESKRHGIVHKVLGHTPRNRRRHIRPQHQGVVVPVKELKHLPVRHASPVLAENIKIFKTRSLDMLISVQIKGIQNLVLNCQLFPAFSVITVLYALRRMNQTIIPCHPVPCLYVFSHIYPVLLFYGKVLIH